MSEEAGAREDITRSAKPILDRGLTCGSSCSISVRLSDGKLLDTPTGSSVGFLDPAQISRLPKDGQLISGHKLTKEIALHTAFYDARPNWGRRSHTHDTFRGSVDATRHRP